MSMAHRGPGKKRNRRVNITDHSLDSLDKRMNHEQHGHRLRHDLGNLLDQAINEQLSMKRGQGDIEVWYEMRSGKAEETKVVDIRSYFDGLFAILRSDGHGRNKYACVTVLTTDMVEKNKANGQWARTPEKLGDTTLKSSPFHVLEDMDLGDIATNEAAPPIKVSPINEKAADAMKQRAMIIWQDGVEERKAILMPAQVSMFVKDLIEKGIQLDQISLWSQRPLGVKTTIEVVYDL